MQISLLLQDKFRSKEKDRFCHLIICWVFTSKWDLIGQEHELTMTVIGKILQDCLAWMISGKSSRIPFSNNAENIIEQEFCWPFDSELWGKNSGRWVRLCTGWVWNTYVLHFTSDSEMLYPFILLHCFRCLVFLAWSFLRILRRVTLGLPSGLWCHLYK